MTEQEALIYFPNGRSGLDDEFAKKLFEIKQLLISRFPISKIYRSRIQRIKILQEAYESLGGLTTRTHFDGARIEFKINSIRLVVSEYAKVRNSSKLNLMQAFDVNDIELILIQFISVTIEYAEFWNVMNTRIEDVLIGKEPDPMEIIEAISEFESNGYQSFEDLVKLDSKNPLVKESKRLSLWLKLEGNGN